MDSDRVKTELVNAGVLLEEFGGEAQSVLVSAKTGQGIEELLEKILLQVYLLLCVSSGYGTWLCLVDV